MSRKPKTNAKTSEKKVEEEVADKPQNNRRPRKGKGKDAINDIGWYSRYPAIYDAAANLVWSRPAGIPVLRGYQEVSNTTLASNSVDILMPNIMVFDMVHGIGNTNIAGTNAPVNVAAKAIYTWVRHMNSGHANYDAPDLMLYLLAMNEAYAAISFIGRAFGTAAMYSGGNRRLPKALFDLQHIDGDSIRDNFANFRARINILIQKAASLVVPMGMDIFNRTNFLYANYYTEGDSVKDQIYFMAPSGFRVFDRDSSGAGYLKWMDLSSWYSGGSLTWGSLCQILEDILTPLIADEDINIMAGDMLKAYGDGQIQKLVFLPELYIATPQRVEEVLWQFKNAKAAQGTVSNLDITQDGNHEYLIFEPTVTAAAIDVAANTADALMVTDKVPTKEINMINSRLVINADYGVVGATPNAGIIICGSDFVRSIRFTGMTTVAFDRNYPRAMVFSSPDLVAVAAAQSFKFAPELSFFHSNTGLLSNITNFDVDDFTVVDRNTLMTIHDAAVLSLFAVPHIGM